MCPPKIKTPEAAPAPPAPPPAPAETATEIKRGEDTATKKQKQAAQGLEQLRITLNVPKGETGLGVPQG